MALTMLYREAESLSERIDILCDQEREWERFSTRCASSSQFLHRWSKPSISSIPFQVVSEESHGLG